jgi:hypothetical protein
MSDFNEELISEINSLRTNPRIYARKILKYIKYFKGKLFCLSESDDAFQTEEGPDAFREAADFLSKQSRLEPLKPSKGLCRIAEDFISVVQKDSNVLEVRNMEDIINKYGEFNGVFSNVMDFGGKTPEQAIIFSIVNDGDKSREQRESLLSSEIKSIGVANGEHKIYRHCTSIVVCTIFENTYDFDDNGLLKKNADDNEKKRNKYQKTDKYYEKGKEELPKGVASLEKTDEVIMENGLKKKITKIIKVMKDGSIQIETTKKVLNE